MAPLSPRETTQHITEIWQQRIVPRLIDYIRIPAKSPQFDPDWATRGHIDEAIALAEDWCREQALAQMTVEVIRLEGRTPVLLIEIPGCGEGRVLLYGHLDKQPEMTGWDSDKGPWQPLLAGDRLYGRGGADDGYALFAALTALQVLQEQRIAHSRCLILIETCEESGSYDLPHYIDALGERLGQPDLVICLDSGCGSYDRLWLTSSLRGLAAGELSVEILTEGVHSGDASGIAPCSFRLIRQLLARIEDADSGRILPDGLHAEIPTQRREQARRAGEILGERVFDRFPFVPGARPNTEDPTQLILNRTWRPALTVTGAEGLPALADAGNVLRPATALRLSLRLPPTVAGETASALLRELLETDAPYGSRVRFRTTQATTGWNAPLQSGWLTTVVDQASQDYFGQPAAYMGEGGSIPFMTMLGERFPAAQFLITGVLGPHANAHGPNEFLHLPTAQRLTACVASVIAGQYCQAASSVGSS
ncbi:M20 family metallopeptidase [Nitrococcus mobilis]|uniref:Succinyl-diaminopimelate desuccinylase n=1 Tax=Nitrococcus mobilis Nb-231 TaxID=314278 RepID=A4BVP5_9GAMM|nr:M20 family metallopeptidase [Nitrococcus mobilis]EAR20227.1 succinyl-diaminopimelate desuccinylase [Nitrococcus mobilis Nb-231]